MPTGYELVTTQRQERKGVTVLFRDRLTRKVVQKRAKEPVEPLRRRDAEPLARGMRADDLWTERDHLDTRELASDHCAFEPAVDDLEAWRDSE